jgi:hypothetical protein
MAVQQRQHVDAVCCCTIRMFVFDIFQIRSGRIAHTCTGLIRIEIKL